MENNGYVKLIGSANITLFLQSYVIGMLTNFDSLPLDRIHNMLKVSNILSLLDYESRESKGWQLDQRVISRVLYVPLGKLYTSIILHCEYCVIHCEG